MKNNVLFFNEHYPSSKEKEIRLKKKYPIIIETYDFYKNIIDKREKLNKI